MDHFLRLDQNWNCARKASGTQSRLGAGGGDVFLGLNFLDLWGLSFGV